MRTAWTLAMVALIGSAASPAALARHHHRHTVTHTYRGETCGHAKAKAGGRGALIGGAAGGGVAALAGAGLGGSLLAAGGGAVVGHQIAKHGHHCR